MTNSQITTQAWATERRTSRRLTWRDWSVDPATRAAARQTFAGTRLKGVPAGASALSSASVLIMGLGSIGGRAMPEAARLGFGSLSGVDPDAFGHDSFLTQPAQFDEAGHFKAHVHGKLASRANPAVRVRTAIGLAQDVPLAQLRQADVWLAAGDNLELMCWLGGKAAELGKVLIQGAIHPESWTAIVRVYDLRDPDAPCPSCALSHRDQHQLRAIEGCAGAPGGEPTRGLPPVCGLAAHLVVAEAAKWLLGQQETALRGEYAHSLLTHRGYKTLLERNPDCRGGHRRWEQIDLTESVAQATPALLASRLGVHAPTWELQVSGEEPWFSTALCQGCGRQHAWRRFGRHTDDAGHCDCGGLLRLAPQGQRRVVPAADLAEVWDLPLADLGVPEGGALGLSLGEQGHYFFTRDLTCEEPNVPEETSSVGVSPTCSPHAPREESSSLGA